MRIRLAFLVACVAYIGLSHCQLQLGKSDVPAGTNALSKLLSAGADLQASATHHKKYQYYHHHHCMYCKR